MPTGFFNKAALLERSLGDVWLGIYIEVAGKGPRELEAENYFRQPAHFEIVDGTEDVANSAVVAFPVLPAVKVTHVGAWTEKEGGTLLWSVELERATVVEAKATFFFEAGALAFPTKELK